MYHIHYIIVALPDNGRNYRPKHVVLHVINNHLLCCIDRINNKQTPIEEIQHDDFSQINNTIFLHNSKLLNHPNTP